MERKEIKGGKIRTGRAEPGITRLDLGGNGDLLFNLCLKMLVLLPFIHLSIYYQSIHLFIQLFTTCPFIHPSIPLPICPSV